jgi:DNA-binding NarL/FixJ family response regulator
MVPRRLCRHHGGMMKLLVVDDSELIRSRLVGMLQGIPGVQEVGTADTLQRTLYSAAHFLPALVVLDLNLPDGNALQIIPRLKRMVPGLRIAVLTNDAHPVHRELCQQAGADWFFDKSKEFEQLLDLLRQQATLH